MFRFLKPKEETPLELLQRADAQLRENCRQMARMNVLVLEQQQLIDTMLEAMAERDHAVLAYAEEVARLTAQDHEQMERLTAYARWCDRQGCAPTDADLEEMIR